MKIRTVTLVIFIDDDCQCSTPRANIKCNNTWDGGQTKSAINARSYIQYVCYNLNFTYRVGQTNETAHLLFLNNLCYVYTVGVKLPIKLVLSNVSVTHVVSYKHIIF